MTNTKAPEMDVTGAATPQSNPEATTATQHASKETIMKNSTTVAPAAHQTEGDIEILEGLAYELDEKHRYYKPIEMKTRRRPEDVAAGLVTDLRAGRLTVGTSGLNVYDENGVALSVHDSRWPHGAKGLPNRPNTMIVIDGLAFVGRGMWWLSLIEEDGEEWVEFTNNGIFPCNKVEWCTGHRYAMFPDDDEDGHFGEMRTIHDFDSLGDEATVDAKVGRMILSDGRDVTTVEISIDAQGDSMELRKIALELQALAGKILEVGGEVRRREHEELLSSGVNA